jgi:hypothetical protein
VDARLDRDDGEMVEHLERGDDPRAMIALTAPPAASTVSKMARNARTGLGHGHKPDDQLGDHRAGALAADQRADEVEPGWVHPRSAGGDHGPVGEHERQPRTWAWVSRT